MLISSSIRGAFPVMLITLAYSLICSGLPVVRESLRQQNETTTHGLDKILQGMSMFFPDFGVLDLKDSILSMHSVESMIGMPVWIPFGLISVYLVIVLLLSCMIYERRDIL